MADHPDSKTWRAGPASEILDGLPGRPSGHTPSGIDPESAGSVERYLRSRTFPSAKDGHFSFAYIDHGGAIEQVRLRHGLAGHRQSPEFFRCAGGVYLLDFHAPAVNRLEYQLALIQADGSEQNISDPMNTLSVRDPFSEKSVVLTADYREPWYVAEQVPELAGTLQELTLAGPKRGKWKSWIWHPPEARPDEILPVILFLDGGDYLRFAGAGTVLANLVSRDAIKRCRAVFVSPSQRNDEYSCNRDVARHLMGTLPRCLAKHIPIPADSAQRIAVGASLGGLCLLHAHLTGSTANQSFFGGLLLQSSSYFQPTTDSMEVHFGHFDRITAFVSRVLNESFNVPRIPLYMTCGRGEENLTNNRVMAAALQAQGFPLKFVEHPDAHNWTSWRDCLGDGLSALLHKEMH